MNVAVLSGGVGGARFLRGLVGVVDPGNVSIVGNIADDIEVLGLRVSPDLDSILYTLSGLSDEERGWGRSGETWQALETVAELGGEDWFKLGDRDIGLHLVRTELLRSGVTLTEATARIAHALGLEARLLPASDDPVRTFVETPAGTFPFQTWFVGRGHRDASISDQPPPLCHASRTSLYAIRTTEHREASLWDAPRTTYGTITLGVQAGRVIASGVEASAEESPRSTEHGAG